MLRFSSGTTIGTSCVSDGLCCGTPTGFHTCIALLHRFDFFPSSYPQPKIQIRRRGDFLHILLRAFPQDCFWMPRAWAQRAPSVHPPLLIGFSRAPGTCGYTSELEPGCPSIREINAAPPCLCAMTPTLYFSVGIPSSDVPSLHFTRAAPGDTPIPLKAAIACTSGAGLYYNVKKSLAFLHVFLDKPARAKFLFIISPH
jgi:hypothetical protein